MLGRSPSSLHVTLQGDSRDPNYMSSNGYGYFETPANDPAYPQQWQTVTPHPAITVSLPLAFGSLYPNQVTGSTGLNAAASGAYDAAYTKMVNHALVGGYNKINWRLGWEFDGTWMPWSSRNDPAAFKAAYMHVRALILNLMPGSTFELCGSNQYISNPDGSLNNVWSAAYPYGSDASGRTYVDTVGLDVYDFNFNTTAALFAANVQKSLTTQEAFAKAQGANVAYPEWGLGDGTKLGDTTKHDNPFFIQSMANWFNSLPAYGPGSMSYSGYFNANVDGASAIDMNPNAKVVFIKSFTY